MRREAASRDENHWVREQGETERKMRTRMSRRCDPRYSRNPVAPRSRIGYRPTRQVGKRGG